MNKQFCKKYKIGKKMLPLSFEVGAYTLWRRDDEIDDEVQLSSPLSSSSSSSIIKKPLVCLQGNSA